MKKYWHDPEYKKFHKKQSKDQEKRKKKRKKSRKSNWEKKYDVILIPKDIDFKDNISNIELLKSEFKKIIALSHARTRINLSKLNNISINGLLHLISEIDILQSIKNQQNKTSQFKYNSKFGIKKYKRKLRYLLREVGYWEYFNIKKPYSIDKETKNDYFLSIETGTISESCYVAKIRDFILKKVDFLETEEIQEYFDDAITEAMANSVEHGYISETDHRMKGKWWLCGHYDKNANYLEFSFRDYGVGLRKTLEYNSSDKIISFFREIILNNQLKDADIIEILVNDKLPKYKAKNDKVRGYGFKRFKEFAKNIEYNCEMKIISGNGKYDYTCSYNDNDNEKNETETVTNMDFSINGVLISWKIYLGDNNERNN